MIPLIYTNSVEEKSKHLIMNKFHHAHLMPRWSLAQTPCWQCFQKCRDWWTRADGDVTNSTAAEEEIRNSFIRNFKGRAGEQSGCCIDSDLQPSRVRSFITNTIPHWLASPLILIGLTFTSTILITTQQNASSAGHVVTSCLEVY